MPGSFRKLAYSIELKALPSNEAKNSWKADGKSPLFWKIGIRKERAFVQKGLEEMGKSTFSNYWCEFSKSILK